MRSTIAALILVAAGATTATAQMAKDDWYFHALHGLMHMYAAGSVCSYRKWSFSKQETDEMLQKINELGKKVPPKTNDEMWSEARDIMAEGQGSASPDSCAKVHQQYAIGRPYIFGSPPGEPEKAPL